MERDIGQPARLPGALHTASRGPSAPALRLPNRSPPRPHEPRWTAGPGPHTSPAPLRTAVWRGEDFAARKVQHLAHLAPDGVGGGPCLLPRPRLGEPLTAHARAPVRSPPGPAPTAPRGASALNGPSLHHQLQRSRSRERTSSVRHRAGHGSGLRALPSPSGGGGAGPRLDRGACGVRVQAPPACDTRDGRAFEDADA